jgi:hypothetical protein
MYLTIMTKLSTSSVRQFRCAEYGGHFLSGVHITTTRAFHEDDCRPGSRGSSVSTVSDYELDSRAIGVRSPAEAKDFSSNLCVQTGSGAHPASCTVDTGGPFPGAKRGRGMTLTTHPHLMLRSRMSRSYISSPPKRHHDV